MPADNDLARAAAGGDRRALDALLGRDHDRLYALYRRLAGNDADAADATQEALLAVVRGLPRWDGRSSYRTWSYRVATNACLDELRRRSRRPRPVDLDARSPHAAGLTASVDFADRVVAGVDIDRLLADLPDDHRAVVVLRDLCGLDYAELAEVLDVPIGTVRSRLARARGSLANAAAGNPTLGDERPRTGS